MAFVLLFLWVSECAAHRYQLCNFSCAGERWLACRAEKCTPRLPEDACADGAEAALVGADNSTAVDDAGIQVSGPRECAEVWEAPLPGSFAERCDLCMTLVGELSALWHEATEAAAAAIEAAASGAEPAKPSEATPESAATEGDGACAAAEGDGASAPSGATQDDGACTAAHARAEAMLPTLRTCRYHPPACAEVLAAARERACPELWAMRRAGETQRVVRARERQLCGALTTQRNGSGVDDALVCPHPRDVGARVMAISAVVATVLLAAQAGMGVHTGVAR